MSRVPGLRALALAAAWIPACAAAPPPDDVARIGVWHDAPVPGGVRIYVDGVYAGTLRQYVARGTPGCSSSGTFTLRVPAGTPVLVVAEASDGRRWKREMSAGAGACRTLLLAE